MKPELENLKEYTSKPSLTPEEKFDMFNNLRAYSTANPVRSKYTMLFRHSFTYASVFALLIGTSATSLAAQGSLPGDILYPIKTEINEEVIKGLSFSQASKAKITVNLMDTRMSELEEMIIKEVDNPEKIDVIVAMLEEHKDDLQDFTNQVEESDQEEVQEAAEIYVALESVIDTHIEILEEIAEDKGVQLAVAQIADVVITNSAPEAPTEEEPNDVTVVLTMKAAPPLEPISEPATMTAMSEPTATSTDDSTNTIALTTDIQITGEEDAITEITNFSTRIDPLIDSAKSKNLIHNEATSTQIRTDIRKRIISNVEKELQIDIDEEEILDIEE